MTDEKPGANELDQAIARLRAAAGALVALRMKVGRTDEEKMLATCLLTWVRVVAEGAYTIAAILETTRDYNSATALLRTLREECIDTCQLAHSADPKTAAIRAHLYQRLTHKKLAKRNLAVAKNPTFDAFERDLAMFQEAWPDLCAEVDRLPGPNQGGHWSGMKIGERLAVAKWKDPEPRLFGDLMSITLHESADLLQIILEGPDASGRVHVKSSRETTDEHLQSIADLATAYLAEVPVALKPFCG